MREMISFGAGIYAKNLLEYAVQNLDNLVVGRMIGITALGFYDKAYSTVSRVTTKINLAGPSVSFRIFALIQDEPERFRRAYRKVVLSVTLVGYPVLTGMIVAAPQLIEVLYGRQWLPAILPFQILAAAAMLRLLNTYASSATQAKGRIWAEVRRQALFILVLVVAVAALSPWGIAGAAGGVLLSTIFMTVLLQSLVGRLSGLSWADMLAPQIPAVVCSAGLLVVVLLTRMAVQTAYPQSPPLLVLAACAITGAVYYVGFLLTARFGDVREVVHETAQDLAPGIAKRLPWLAPAAPAVPALSER
jgi:O-antigen/teichoic acid export membrane protein